MSIYKTYDSEFSINNVQVPVKITIRIEEDYEYDLSDWDDKRDQERIKSGKLFVACVDVEAHAFGLQGFDSLGACTLRPNNMFNHEPFENDVDAVLVDYQMVENAIEQLKTKIIDQAKVLSPFAKE